ncbi:unnamed protein product [Fraxinus pennsylvanica]|uniref:Uncharacterized protein n=1 Tax=Fraxinus pennsylvanica TaxID=56036 RepID=A0AAD1Z8C1_9LAMI|nr:unnamed protein product [Fraxinus pennsylvanica]
MESTKYLKLLQKHSSESILCVNERKLSFAELGTGPFVLAFAIFKIEDVGTLPYHHVGNFRIADTFAILLEGWEKEGNVAKAKTTFGEMVIGVGWSPQYISPYDAF